MKDIFVVPEYAAEIDSHLREAELRTRPKPNYMRKQNDLTPQMRSILIDWLVEVSNYFHFQIIIAIIGGRRIQTQ